MGDEVVGIYCRPLDQEEQVDEASYRQLRSSLTFKAPGPCRGLLTTEFSPSFCLAKTARSVLASLLSLIRQTSS